MLSGLAAPSSRLEVGGDIIEAGAYALIPSLLSRRHQALGQVLFSFFG